MSPFRILYVDDEAPNLVSFRATFRRHFHIYTAQNGQEALEFLAQQEVDLIISDQRMPEMTGVQLFEQIIELYPEPVRMVLTGYSDIKSVIDAINKGKVYYFITKPWQAEELRLIIDHALEAYQLKRENRRLEDERNRLLLQAERQQKEHILAQFETLKNQVNPHFLFNSLNALASLIYEDVGLADQFINKLTKVYRYVLDYKDKALVSLADEIKVFQDYFFLQKIRFGDNLQLELELPDSLLDRQIPPLTLQMLGENAIKHNIISREQPLLIELRVEGDMFLIKNNFQPRLEEVVSTGLGLENLRARYSFLADAKPQFGEEGTHYVARVPLL